MHRIVAVLCAVTTLFLAVVGFSCERPPGAQEVEYSTLDAVDS